MTGYEEFIAEVRRLKRERWAKILASEPAGRAAGRRPRDPDKERLLTDLDRSRLREKDYATKLPRAMDGRSDDSKI